MDKVYRSKVDWWLWLVLSVGFVVISVSAVARLVNLGKRMCQPLDRPGNASAGRIHGVASLLGLLYMVTAMESLVRAAVFRWRIPLDQIVEIYPTHNPLVPRPFR